MIGIYIGMGIGSPAIYGQRGPTGPPGLLDDTTRVDHAFGHRLLYQEHYTAGGTVLQMHNAVTVQTTDLGFDAATGLHDAAQLGAFSGGEDVLLYHYKDQGAVTGVTPPTAPANANAPKIAQTGTEVTVGGHLGSLFDGTDDYLVSSQFLGSDLFETDQATAFFVLRQDGSNANNAVHNWNPLSGDGSLKVLVWASVNDAMYWTFGKDATIERVSVLQPAGWDNAVHVLEMYRNGSTMELLVDGVVIGSNTTVSVTLDTNRMGVLYTGTDVTGKYFKGEILLRLFHRFALSSAERTAIRTKLMDAYLP